MEFPLLLGGISNAGRVEVILNISDNVTLAPLPSPVHWES